VKVVVCAKQIPDANTPAALDPETKTLVRGTLVLDDSDTYGVEMGLQIADATGGEVTLVSMGPEGQMQGLRSALAMGAAKAVVVSDPELPGADALSTAKVLAAAIQREGFDLVITATESTDGYTGTIPAQVAHLLGVPCLTFAKKVEAAEGRITIHRQTELGYDVVESALPAVISVTAGVVEPRYPSFKGIMAAKSKPVDQLGLADLGLDSSSAGGSAAGQEIVSVEPAPERRAGEIVEDDGEGYQKIVDYLESIKVI
jgi:electron transfer flavoprotein beta subunit